MATKKNELILPNENDHSVVIPMRDYKLLIAQAERSADQQETVGAIIESALKHFGLLPGIAIDTSSIKLAQVPTEIALIKGKIKFVYDKVSAE